MGSDIEQLEMHRRRMLLGFAVAFALWQLPEIVAAVIELPRWVRPLVAIVVVAGVLGFLFYGWRMTSLAGELAGRPELAEVLNDERIRGLRERSFVIGFWALLGYVALLHAVTLLAEPPAIGALIRLGLVIGVLVPIASYLVMDRDDGNAGR